MNVWIKRLIAVFLAVAVWFSPRLGTKSPPEARNLLAERLVTLELISEDFRTEDGDYALVWDMENVREDKIKRKDIYVFTLRYGEAATDVEEPVMEGQRYAEYAIGITGKAVWQLNTATSEWELLDDGKKK